MSDKITIPIATYTYAYIYFYLFYIYLSSVYLYQYTCIVSISTDRGESMDNQSRSSSAKSFILNLEKLHHKVLNTSGGCFYL